MKTLKPLLAAAGALFASASASVISYCPVVDQFCMSIGVPQSTASSGSGNIYFQVQAVADAYSWVAVGTGTIMSDSNIFVLYADGAGNVTVSTRRGTGHTMPQPQSDTRFQLLSGSGVQGGVLTANIMCSNCESWDGGEMDLSGTQTAWIAAWRDGSPLNTQSVDTRIVQHQGQDQFRFDLTQALVSGDANPFVTGAGAGNGGGNNGNNNGAGGGAGNGAGGTGLGSGNTRGASSVSGSRISMLLIHGIIMTVAFAFLYPLGAMLIPLVGKWYIHVGCQVLAFLTMWGGFATGYITARDVGTLFRDAHTILGTIIVSAMVLQPAFGLLHHRYYQKHQERTVVSHVHIWYGRVLMLMGVVNGGIGLRAAGSPSTFTIAYAVVAAVSGVAYIATVLVGGMKKKAGRETRAKEGAYSPSGSAGGYSAGGYSTNFESNGYGYQTGRGADVTRNPNFQFERRGRDQTYGWSR